MGWLTRLARTLRSRRLDDELDEELRGHLEARAADLAEGGLSPEEAAREARRRLGGALALREASRDVKLIPWLDSVARDVRFGLRVLRKDALVTGAAIVSLSLAIGACTAAFSLIEALILRPLPVAEPERLVYLTFTVRSLDGALDPTEENASASFSYPLFERLREAGRPYVDLFGMNYQDWRRPAVFDDSPGREERVRAQWVSGDAFALLGVRPALGRLLSAADDQRPGDHPVAVLSHAFWRRRFGGSPGVLGRWLTLEEKQLQIVGVAEERLVGTEPGLMTDLWVPNMMYDREALAQPTWQWFRIWGRLKPGIDAAQARQALQPVFTAFRRERAQGMRADEPPARIERYINAPLDVRSAANGPSALRKRFERPLWILAAVVGLLLLIACSNVANLLVARAARREREMALRISIGAGRARVVQQVLVESALLAAAACILGGAFALLAAPMIVSRLAPASNPAYLELHLNGPLFAFLAGICALATLLFGAVPALRASAVSPNAALKADGARHSAGRGLVRPLVAAQVGFSFVVLFVTGLLLLSFYKLARLDPGFAKDGLVLVDVQTTGLRRGERTPHRVWAEVLAAARRMPGVRAASLSGFGLFSGNGWSMNIRLPGQAADTFEPYYLGVSPGFFETMGLPLLAGRDLEPRDADEGAPAVVVNQAFARRYFPGESPLGRHFSLVEQDQKLADQEIVGLAGDARYLNLRDPVPPTVYVAQRDDRRVTIELRTAADPGAVAAALRPEIARINAALRVDEVTTQSRLIDETILSERLLALLSGFFAVVALVLVAVGLYGVLSYAVARRTKEIGIRLALGARPGAVVRLVVGDVGLLVAAGLAGGVAVGLLLARFLASLLFEVHASDFWSLALPLGWLLLATALAALPAAARAVRIDPTVALRYE
jgi:putative ABC transport system permease protein